MKTKPHKIGTSLTDPYNNWTNCPIVISSFNCTTISLHPLPQTKYIEPCAINYSSKISKLTRSNMDFAILGIVKHCVL